MYTYNEPSFERVRRIRLLRLKYLNDNRCRETTFARALGIDYKKLKRIENGREEFDFYKAAKVLQVSVDYLLSGRIMAEDQCLEPIVFMHHIGSVMHAARMQMWGKSSRADRKECSLKAVSQKLGISSMELKRIEGLNKSKNIGYSARNVVQSGAMRFHVNERFLKRVSEVLGVELACLRELAAASFPLGEEKKAIVLKSHQAVRFVAEGDTIKGLFVLNDGLTTNAMHDLKRRIEIEVDILRSKSHQKQPIRL